MREEFRQQLKGRLISPKVGCVTRMGRSMLGVNIHIISGGKMFLRVLAMKELKEGHTASCLQKSSVEVRCRDVPSVQHHYRQRQKTGEISQVAHGRSAAAVGK